MADMKKIYNDLIIINLYLVVCWYNFLILFWESVVKLPTVSSEKGIKKVTSETEK
jgi:hypothetical protein